MNSGPTSTGTTASHLTAVAGRIINIHIYGLRQCILAKSLYPSILMYTYYLSGNDIQNLIKIKDI